MPKSPDAFRTISEVAEWLDTPAHVLRFWESKFTQIKPVKRAGGRRYYRPSDMALLGGIKKLLHDDGLTIKGAQKLLREHGVKHVAALSQPLDDELVVEAGFESTVDAAQEPSEEGKVLSFPSAETAPAAETETTADVPEDKLASQPEPETVSEPEQPAAKAGDDAPLPEPQAPPASTPKPETNAPLSDAPLSKERLPAFLQRAQPARPSIDPEAKLVGMQDAAEAETPKSPSHEPQSEASSAPVSERPVSEDTATAASTQQDAETVSAPEPTKPDPTEIEPTKPEPSEPEQTASEPIASEPEVLEPVARDTDAPSLFDFDPGFAPATTPEPEPAQAASAETEPEHSEPEQEATPEPEPQPKLDSAPEPEQPPAAATKPARDVPSLARIAPELESFQAAPGLLAALPCPARLSKPTADEIAPHLDALRALRDRIHG